MNTSYPLTIFYDGACGVCSKEMSYYQKIADERVVFVNIATQDFFAGNYKKTEEEFQKQLHACDANGHFFTGVDAFRKLWKTLPSPFYPFLSDVVGLPGIHLAARTGYAIFARYRHLLPSSSARSCSLRNKNDR